MKCRVFRVLLVEDDPIDARLVRDMLSGPGGTSYALEWTTSLADGLAKLGEGGFDLALVDLDLPDSHGQQTLERIRSHAPRVPIVALTDTDEEHVDAIAACEGAADYLPKRELSRSLLQRSIRYAVERQDAEQALLAAREEHRSIIQASPLGIISIDASGQVTSWSSSAEQILGWSADEVIGRPNPIHPMDSGEGEDQLWRLLSSERFTGAELQVRAKDGGIIDVSLSSAPVRRADGRGGAVITVEDVTAQHQLGEQLRQAQKLEAIGQLAGGVAHDFNNLLAAIMGYAELLAGQVKGDVRLCRYSSAIQEACQSAVDLTGQLLAFSRRGRTRTEYVPMHDIIRQVAEVLEFTVDRRIRVSMDLEAPSAFVWGDPAQLQSAILNLAANARDAMPDGGDLTFATRVTFLDGEDGRQGPYYLPPDEYLEICVTDTGTGISEALLDRIFEPFFTTKEVGRGTGLGLSAAYGIVRDHGGGLRVQSRPGAGSSFRIYLPLSSDSAPTPGVEVPPEATGRSGVLLVADDEDMVRSLVAEMLQRAGYRVLTAANGREAVDIYREHHDEIGLVILDMVMPELSGREAFMAMRGIEPNVKALISSGYSLDLNAGILNEPGIMGMVPKPCRHAVLCQAVARALAD